MIYVSPSLLASDFSRLGDECKKLSRAGADFIHFDVMDGIFVHNISMGIPVLKTLAYKVKAVFDVHLMIINPMDFVDEFADAGAGILTFHLESESDINKTIEKIKNRGIMAGISVKPTTPISSVFPYLDKLDMVLVMTVEPGFGGQSFIPEMHEKISELSEEVKRRGKCNIFIEVDGGINDETAKKVISAGANVLVAGSYIFCKDDYAEAILRLKTAGDRSSYS